MLQIYSVAKMSDPRYPIKKKKISWGALLAQSLECVTPGLRVVSLSLMLGVEIT